MSQEPIKAEAALPNTLSATKEEVSCEWLKGPEGGQQLANESWAAMQ